MNRRHGKILMVDDEVELLELSSNILRREGHTVTTVEEAPSALDCLKQEAFDVILLDLRMPRMGGLEFLEIFKQQPRQEEVVILTAYADVESAIKAIKLGAYGYLSKPFDADEVLAHIDKILELQGLRTENKRLRREKGPGLGQLIGQHEKMQQIYQLVQDVAPAPVPVLIRGKSGTGKELVAQAIHHASDRADEAFVRCNCAALAPGVLESELFGHVKGAFTGAVRDRKGRFEEADGGTLFLDEIGDLEVGMQIRLLRVLQEGEFEPVGSTETKKVDVRLITATHKDLELAMQEERFREDLFYRINTMTIELPSLKDRQSDIPLLCAHFIEKNNAALNKTVKGITPEALQCLENYGWPGNIREMENVIMRAMVLAKGDEIGMEHLPMSKQEEPQRPVGSNEMEPIPMSKQEEPQRPVGSEDPFFDIPEGLFHEARGHFERIFIRRVLTKTKGNISQAAEMMQLGRRNLQRKIKQYQIDTDQFSGDSSI